LKTSRSDPLPEGTSPSRLEAWLSTNRRRVLIGLLVIAAAIRLVYFVQLNAGPLVWQHRWDQSDMAFFDTWARDIAAGDWLTDKALHPQHSWHLRLSKQYYARHQDERERLRAEAGGVLSDEQASQVLWNRWYGGKRFHQEPLYPYLVALTYRLVEPDVRWVFAWQMMLGVANVLLLYLIALRMFGELPGAVAGLLALLCSPLLMYEMVLLRETLVVTSGLATVLMLHEAMLRDRARWWMANGVMLGLGITLKATLALRAALALAIVAGSRIRARPRSVSSAGLMTAGMLIALLPMMARNLAVDRPALEGSSVGTITYVCANTADYPADRGFFVPPIAGEIMDRSDGRLGPAVLECLRTFPSTSAWLKQQWRKLATAWHWYEIPDNANLYYYRLHAGILYLPVTFRLVGPLALLGLALGLGTLRRSWPLYLLVATTLAELLVFYTASRFRLPLMAALIPFAALAVVQLVRWFATRRRLQLGLASVALLAMAAWINQPLGGGRQLVRAADFGAPRTYYYLPEFQRAKVEGDHLRAAEILNASLKARPAFVDAMSQQNPPRTADELNFARMISKAELDCAAAYTSAGRPDSAKLHTDQAARLRSAIEAAQSGIP